MSDHGEEGRGAVSAQPSPADLCACGHWRKDHVRPDRPGACSFEKKLLLGPTAYALCTCPAFQHVVVDLPLEKGRRK